MSSDLPMCPTHIMCTHTPVHYLSLLYLFYYPTLMHTLGKTLAGSPRWILNQHALPPALILEGTDRMNLQVLKCPTHCTAVPQPGVQLSACRRPGLPCPRERTKQIELACTSRCLVAKYGAVYFAFSLASSPSCLSSRVSGTEGKWVVGWSMSHTTRVCHCAGVWMPRGQL